MNLSPPRDLLKRILGLLPSSAGLYQALRPEVVPEGSFSIPKLETVLPSWKIAVQSSQSWVAPVDRRRVLIVGSLKWWLEYDIALGMLLTGIGHSVDLAYLPFRDWSTPVSRFDELRGVHYLNRRLQDVCLPLEMKSLSKGRNGLGDELEKEMQVQARLDVQYTLQREDIDILSDTEDRTLYRLRLERNRRAAASIDDLLHSEKYDVIIIPNGSILEFGAVYRTARLLGVEVVTYEFGEQRQRVWLAQNDEVMRLNTADLWAELKDTPLRPSERVKVEKLFQARRGGQTWEQFKRQWQAGGSEGAQRARLKLGLDPDRPIVLLCTNVVADSLALNRQVFTTGMADWLSRTVSLFGEMPDYQLIVRVHPGEMLGAGHPSVEIVKDTLPSQPEHVVVVPPDSAINTYDLIELAHVGLVYTTTAGLEMSMHGVPVITAGDTHYKGKGFTYDPRNWDEYVSMLCEQLRRDTGEGLSNGSVDVAWRYAYRFFFDYPFEFPWHLLSFWDDLSARPFEEMVQPQNMKRYQCTLNALVGNPIDWKVKVGKSAQAEEAVEG